MSNISLVVKAMVGVHFAGPEKSKDELQDFSGPV